MKILTITSLAIIALTGCGEGQDTASDPMIVSTCGDIDGGYGTDTGNVPDVLGNWTSSFAAGIHDDDCGLHSEPYNAFSFLNSPFEIAGVAPAGLRMELSDDSIGWLHGIESSTGGMVFSGQFDSSYGTAHIAVSGLVYEDAGLGGVAAWEGMVIIGIDTDLSGSIDCTVKGDFRALHSG